MLILGKICVFLEMAFAAVIFPWYVWAWPAMGLWVLVLGVPCQAMLLFFAYDIARTLGRYKRSVPSK